MKKKLLSVALFGAFLSISTALVSCGDDYDDTALTEQIAENKTAMETRLTALESAQSALQTAQDALPTFSDVDDLKDQIATAQEAAIAAANIADAAQLVVVNASIDALKTELTELISANADDISTINEKLAEIDTQFAEITGQLTTLQGLVSDNSTAISSLESALTALTNRVSSLEVKVDANITDIAANKSLIEAQTLALETYKELVNTRLDGLDGDIVSINEKIDAILVKVETLEDVLDGVSNEDLTAMQEFLTNWGTTRTDISSEISNLGINLTTAFRTLLNNITLAPQSYWAKAFSYYPSDSYQLSYTGAEVVNDDAFGPAGEIELPKVGDFNARFVNDTIFFIANPSTVDWSGLELSLKNSKGDVVDNISFSMPEGTTRVLTRASSAAPVLQTGVSFDSPSVSSDWVDATRYDGAYTSYILTVTDLNSTDNREIYSKNDIILLREDVAVETNLVATCDSPVAIYDAGATPSAQEKVVPSLNNGVSIWKKYVTVSPTSASNGDIDGVDMVVDGDTDITLSTSDPSLANKTVTFVYHYLYMDGSRGEASFDVVFTKLEYDETQLVLNSTIDFSLPADEQVATSSTVLADLQANIPDVDAWLDEVATIHVAPITTEDNVSPFVGHVHAVYADNTFASLVADPAMAMTYNYSPSTSALSTVKLVFDATVITEEGRYGSTLTFYNALGNIINVVKVYADINAPLSSLFTDAISKVTNTWNSALNVNNVWAQLSDDSQHAIYDVNSSYNGSLDDVKFMSTETPEAFDAFDATNGSIFTVNDPSDIAQHNDGVYPAKSMFSPFAGFVWAVVDNFDYKVLSPVKESSPAWKSGYDNKFTYTADGMMTISHDDIVAIDPSVSSENMYFVGNTPATRAAYVAATDKDWRIASVKFTVEDPNATAGSSNVGLVELLDINDVPVSEIVNPVLFTIHAKPQGGSYAVNPEDYTLNLVMTVTDVFGFTKVAKLDFIVDNGQ